MELPGSEYLYNLSLLAVSFGALSALVTIVRQIKGGPLSTVDVYLVTTFTSASFAQCKWRLGSQGWMRTAEELAVEFLPPTGIGSELSVAAEAAPV